MRVKVTSVAPDTDAVILSYQFEVPTERILFPKLQNQLLKRYAFIDGFKTREEIDSFISKWNRYFIQMKSDLRCELDETDYHYDVDVSEYKLHLDSSDADEPRANSKRTLCRHGDECFTADCPYKHSPDWHVCTKGIRCENYSCSGSHPKGRKTKCRYGSACRTHSCSYLHPNKETHDSRRSIDNHRILSDSKIEAKFYDQFQQEHLILVLNEAGSNTTAQLAKYAAKYLPDGLVVCTQQHPIVAKTFAHRVASEFDRTRVGHSVGYRIGDNTNRKTDYLMGKHIMFVSETVVVHQFQTDQNLSEINVLIMDNVHERTLNTDIILGIAKLLLAKRRDNFRVILTISNLTDPKPFQHFFDRSSIQPLNIKCQTNPVTIENLLPPVDCSEYKFIEEHLVPTLHRLYAKYKGHTLVFLSNQRDIEKALQLFNEHRPEDCVTFPFFGSLPIEEQNKILEFDKRYANRRMVIFCSSILETSFTIDNVQLIVDTGYVRQFHFDTHHQLNVLKTVRISKFSANQRRIKASHTKNGHCVRLYDDKELKDENIIPEILKVPLDLTILQLKYSHFDIDHFPLMTKPNSTSIEHSLKNLKDLRCIDDVGKLTELGELCAALSINPHLGTLMIKIYSEQRNREELVKLATTIVAILSTSASLFLYNENINEKHDTILTRTMSHADKYNSDLLILNKIFNDWYETAIIELSTGRCRQCKTLMKQTDGNACQSCRTNYSSLNRLNNQILLHIESLIEYFIQIITDTPWKLKQNPRTTNKNVPDAEIIGDYLREIFPHQVGHLLVPHLPDEGARLIQSELRTGISNRSIYVQHAHGDKQQYFVTMFIAQLPSGRFIVDRLHQISSRQLPDSRLEQLVVCENIGWSVNKEMRAAFNGIRTESWTKWLVYEYDQISCRLIIWGREAERSRLESTLKPILERTRLKAIECGSIRATFQNGLICSAIEIMESALRLNLQHVPCRTYENLQIWLKEKFGIHRSEVKENNFQVSHSPVSDDDDDYEAPPFYILLKSTEAYQRAIARVPSHYLCIQDALSSSTTGTHMNEKDSWGRQLVLTIPEGSKFMTSKDILYKLLPRAVDCRHFGKRSIRTQPGIKLLNLPQDADETFLYQILQPIRPVNTSIKQTHRDGTGSSSAYIYFADKQEQQQAIHNLQSNFCQQPIKITVRRQKTHELYQKEVMPILEELQAKDPIANTFLITATNRQTAHELYSDIIPKLESSWQIDGSATVTVTHPHLFPNFDSFVEDIAKQFKVAVQLQIVDQKHGKRSTTLRCYFNHGTPQNVTLAASMLTQATSPIIIRLTNHRQKQLFDELFAKKIVLIWSDELKLEVIKKEKIISWIEIRGPQVQQGQLMRRIADYADTFDTRYRILELNSTAANFFGRKKMTDSQLQALNDKWVHRGCHITYLSKVKSIIIYGQPDIKKKDMDSCEDEVKQILSKIATDGSATRAKKTCVFCNKSSYSANTFRACGHAYCRCAATFLLSTYPLQCNEPKCKMNIDMDDLFEIFQEREQLMQVCKKSIQIYLNKTPSLQQQRFCPNSKCEGLLKRDLGYQTCMTCGRNVCPLCSLIDDELHSGRTCDERNMVQKIGEYLPELFKAAEKFARDNWTTQTPPIIRIDYNMALAEKCPSLARFYKGAEALGISPPPDLARGFFTFHGTAPTSIKPICTDGFDPKRRSGQAYGIGEYFGVTAAVSHGYSCRGSTGGPFSMIITLLLQCPQLSTHGVFCHVMNNPVDWSYAYNLPVVVVSYGNQATCSSPLDN